MIHVATPDSGLRVVTERMEGARSATFGVYVGIGSRDEPAEMGGASHFLEHLLFKGTAHRSAREVNELVDSVGGDMNASTGREDTNYYVRVQDEDAELGLDLLLDTVAQPLLEASDVDVERQVILEEIAMNADDPSERVHERWAAAIFDGHGLGQDPLGTEETVSAMPAKTVRQFWDAHYRSANLVVAAAGNVVHEEVVDAATRALGSRTGGSRPRREQPTTSAGAVVETEDTEQVHLVVGVPSFDRSDPDRYALAVVDHAFGGGLSSRLWQEVREARGLAYSVYSFRYGYEGAGVMGAYVGCAAENLDEVLSLVDKAMVELASGGVTERERDIAVGHLMGELALSLEDSGSRMHRIAKAVLVHGEVLTYEEVRERVRAVTVDDARRAAERVLGGPRVVAAVGPVTEGDVEGILTR